MKFQNPSLNIFERTDERTHTHTDKPNAICSPLFQSWGHNKSERIVDEMSLYSASRGVSMDKR